MVKYGHMLIIARFTVKVKSGKDFFLKKVGKFAEYWACHGTAQRRRAQKGGLLAGKALCAERMVRAEYVGLVGLVRRWTLGGVRPGDSGISGAQGLPRHSAATYRPFLRDTRAAGFFPEAVFLPLAVFFPFFFFSG